MENTEERELREMDLHLEQEGMDPEATMSERTCFLWRLYLHTKSSLNSVKQELRHHKAKHVQEMESVQQYLDGIRSLSEQRDSIAMGLEEENSGLSTRLREMVLQQEAQRDEVAEMLSQAGLAEVIPSSPSEQVAYLLVERASLMEKLQQMEAMETKSILPTQSLQGTGSSPQIHKESMDKGALLRGQSPWRKLLGLRKAAQSKQKHSPVTAEQNSGDSAEREREHKRLERDLEEASYRLDLAHKEIRRLTDELESAHLTKIAFEPELQGAQQEVEELKQELEMLQRSDEAELRKANKLNERLDHEIRLLRDRVRAMDSERMTLLEMINKKPQDESGSRETDDSLAPPSISAQGEGPGSQQEYSLSHTVDPGGEDQEDIHKRCCEELEEKLGRVQELHSVVEKLEEQCKEQRRRREEAEQLLEKAQSLCQQQEEQHKSTVNHLQLEIQAKKILLQQKADEIKRQTEELHHTQVLHTTSKQELLCSIMKLQDQVALLEQNSLKMAGELQESKARAEQLEHIDAARHTELQTLYLRNKELERELEAQREKEQALINEVQQEELDSAREQLKTMEKLVQDLQQQMKKTLQQLQMEEAHKAERSCLEKKVRDLAGELSVLRPQVQEHQMERKLWLQREEEMQQQLQSVQIREAQIGNVASDLRHKIKVLETQLETLKSQDVNAQQLRHDLDNRQQECEKLQMQLKQVMLELDCKMSMYSKKHIRHKEKLCKAKQLFLKETAWRDEKIKELETNIGILSNKLEKNNNLMKNITEENEKLLLDNFNLTKTLSEEEEISQSSLNTFTTMKNRLNHVEKENEHLRDATLVMSCQVAALERLVRNMDTACGIEELKKMLPSQSNSTEDIVQRTRFKLPGVLDVTKKYEGDLSFPLFTAETLSSEMGYLN